MTGAPRGGDGTAPGRPVIGLIVPPSGGGVPPECTALYGDAAEFLVVDAALKSLDLEGYSDAETRLPSLAADLARKGAQAVVMMGTSMTFHKGRAHAQAMERMIAEASGKPATSMSAAIIGALKAVGCRRVAVATAYVDEVNDALVRFLDESGIAITHLSALDLREVTLPGGVSEDRLVALGREAYLADQSADGILISCGGLQTLGVTRRLEDEINKPVVSSAVAGAWAAASIGGLDARRSGYGMLLEDHEGPQDRVWPDRSR